jgi:hypothetical protein
MKDEIDLEVGRHALRTFKFVDNPEDGPGITSLFQADRWDGGMVIAECKKKENPCAEAPGDGCMCGIYGTLTLSHLVSQYRSYARNGIGVIAAEGKTIIGDRGLRTSAARLVAYWCNPLYEENFANTAPEAKRFIKVEEMLKEFDFPEEQRLERSDELMQWVERSKQAAGATQLSDADLKKAWHQISDMTKSVTTPGGVAAIKHILGFT